MHLTIIDRKILTSKNSHRKNSKETYTMEQDPDTMNLESILMLNHLLSKIKFYLDSKVGFGATIHVQSLIL